MGTVIDQEGRILQDAHSVAVPGPAGGGTGQRVCPWGIVECPICFGKYAGLVVGRTLLTKLAGHHPAGLCRHLSVSVQGGQLVPSREAAWLLAAQFGFTGGLEACTTWLEELQGHGKAVNLVQPLPT